MDIKKLTEALGEYEDIAPTQKQVDLGEKLATVVADMMENLLKVKFDVTVEDRPCLASDLGEDFPSIRVWTDFGEDLENSFVIYIHPNIEEVTEEEIKDLENCPLSLQLYSDDYGWDEFYTADDTGIEKLTSKVLSELGK